MFAFLTTPALAATLTVGAPYPTIQDAVDASSPGDRIEIPGGVWVGDITVTNDRLLVGLAGMGGTVIDGAVTTNGTVTLQSLTIAPTDAVVSLTLDHRSALTRLEDVELTRAGGTAPVLIDVGQADILLDGAWIHDLETDGVCGWGDDFSAVMKVDGGRVQLERTTVERVTASGCTAALITLDDGGAGTNLIINESSFRDNQADFLFHTQLGSSGRITVTNSTFLGNVIDGPLFMPALNDGLRSAFRNNVFQDNDCGGPLIHAFSSPYYAYGAAPTLVVVGNTFVANTGSVMVDLEVHTEIANNLFAHGTTAITLTGWEPRRLDHNLFWDNERDVDSFYYAAPHPTDVLADPRFVSFSDDGDWTDDDLSLEPSSPAIGAGVRRFGGPRDIGAL